MGKSYKWIVDPIANACVHLGQMLIVGCVEELILVGLSMETDNELTDVDTSFNDISN